MLSAQSTNETERQPSTFLDLKTTRNPRRQRSKLLRAGTSKMTSKQLSRLLGLHSPSLQARWQSISPYNSWIVSVHSRPRTKLRPWRFYNKHWDCYAFDSASFCRKWAVSRKDEAQLNTILHRPTLIIFRWTFRCMIDRVLLIFARWKKASTEDSDAQIPYCKCIEVCWREASPISSESWTICEDRLDDLHIYSIRPSWSAGASES